MRLAISRGVAAPTKRAVGTPIREALRRFFQSSTFFSVLGLPKSPDEFLRAVDMAAADDSRWRW